MKVKVGALLLTGALFLSLASPVAAARKRTRPQASAGPAVASQSRGVKTSISFRPDRRALLISFSGFDDLQSGSYQLVYNANGVPQGAGGSIILGDTGTKTLLFGTCSGGVCTYHQNITDMRLSIISVLKDGTRILKPYRIRP